MAYRQVLIPALFALLWLTLSQSQSTRRPHDTCVYTFNVPKDSWRDSSSPGGGCSGLTELEQQVSETKRDSRLYLDQISAMMTQLSAATMEITKINVEMQKLQSIVADAASGSTTTTSSARSSGKGEGGVTYIRWGRTVCPDHAERLYRGYTAGTKFIHTGGGANYLCLPETPQWGNPTKSGFQHINVGLVYGTEYQLKIGNSPLQPVDSELLNEQDVPCAACHVRGRTAHIMIPGMIQCPTGWTTEYNGYVTTEHALHNSSKVFECLDTTPEVIRGKEAIIRGATMYVAEVECGALPCSEYVSGNELSCVVCTK